MTYLSNWKTLKKHLRNFSYSAATLIALTSTASAFTLNDALISAHEHNYQVLAEAENLEAAKIEKMQSYTGFLPSVNAQAQRTRTKLESAGARARQTRETVNSRSLTISQPIFNGGDTYASVKAADSNLSARKAVFMDVSNEISLETVKAYEGILNTRDILSLNEHNEKVLRENLKLTKTRFKHGEITKTDVLQADARVSTAVADRERAYGNMKSAEAIYARAVGSVLPESLEPISLDHIAIPEAFEEFLNIALKNNPALLASKSNAAVSKYQVNRSYAAVMPSVSAQAQFNRSNITSNTSDNNTYLLNVAVPIVSKGGREYAEIFKAQHAAKSTEYKYKEQERVVREDAVRIWNSYKVAKAVIKASNETIAGSKKALDGVKEEAKAGTRTTLDVLDAQNELFTAQVNKRTAQSELVVAVYSILRLMGALDAIDVVEN